MAEISLNGVQPDKTSEALNNGTSSSVLSEALYKKLRLVSSTLELAKEQVSASKVLLSSVKCISIHLQDFVEMAELDFNNTEKCIDESSKQMEDLKSEIKIICAMAETSTENGKVNSNSSDGTSNDASNLDEDNCNKENSPMQRQYSEISESELDNAHVSPHNPETRKESLHVSQEEVNKSLDCGLGLLPKISSKFPKLGSLPKISRVKMYDSCSDVECYQQTSVKVIDNTSYDIGTGMTNKSTEIDNDGKDCSNKGFLEIEVTETHKLDVTLDARLENLECSNVTFDPIPNLGYLSSCSENCSLALSYSSPDVLNCIGSNAVSNDNECYISQDNLPQMTSLTNAFLTDRLKGLQQKSLECLSIEETSKVVELSSDEDAPLLIEEISDHNSADFVESIGHICEDCIYYGTKLEYNGTNNSVSCGEDKVDFASGRYISFHEELNEALSGYILRLERKDSEEYSYQKLQNVSTLTNDVSINNSQLDSPSYITVSEATTTDTSINDASFTKNDTPISDHWFQYQNSSADSDIIVPDSDQERSSFASSDDTGWIDVTSDSSDGHSSGSCNKISDTESCSQSSHLPDSSPSSSGSFSRDFTSDSEHYECICGKLHLYEQNVSYDSFREGMSDASLNNSQENAIEDSEINSNRCNNFQNLSLLVETSLLGFDKKPLMSSPHSYPSVRKYLNGTLLRPLIKDQCNNINPQNDVVASPVDQDGREVSEVAESEVSSELEEMVPDLVQDIRIPRIVITEFRTYQDHNRNVEKERLEASSDN